MALGNAKKENYHSCSSLFAGACFFIVGVDDPECTASEPPAPPDASANLEADDLAGEDLGEWIKKAEEEDQLGHLLGRPRLTTTTGYIHA